MSPRVAAAIGLVLSRLALGCGVSAGAEAREQSRGSASAPDGRATTREASRPSPSAGTVTSAASEAPATPVCREQQAQDFLLRHGQIAQIGASADRRRQIESARRRSEDYRTQQYGRFPGFGSRADNPHAPAWYAERTTFWSQPIVMHRKVVPALRCVELALKRECAAHPYTPRQIGGMRYDNTYTDYEVSNHVYGIAIDVDPGLNPCCGCVGSWSRAPACRKRVSSPYDRMVMPRCWVEVFERHGFHWLGHDELGDTMHFEFLGDPDRILQPDVGQVAP